MAFIDPTRTVRLDIPDHPGEWVELAPMTVGKAAEIARLDLQNSPDYGMATLVRCIVAWSDPAPINAETIAGLDAELYTWLMAQVPMGRSEEEKKDSASASSPASPTPSDRIPASSLT